MFHYSLEQVIVKFCALIRSEILGKYRHIFTGNLKQTKEKSQEILGEF